MADDSPQPATSARPSRVRYLVIVALCAAAMVAYVQRNSISVAEEAIRDDVGLSKSEMGGIMSAFFLTYALFQLPTGWLAKVLGTRKGMSLFAVTFSTATAAFALASGFPMLAATRLAMGAAQSGIFPCAVNSIAQWLPDGQRSMASGYLGSFMSVGGAVGAALTGAFLDYGYSWREAFLWFCLPGFLLAVAFLLWFRDRPEGHPWVNEAEVDLIRGTAANKNSKSSTIDVNASEPTPWKRMLTSVPILALCGQQFCRAVGYIFFATWFATYLKETRGVGDLEAGLLNSLPLLATVVGSPLGGTISDWVLLRTGNRRLSRQGVAAASMLACFVLILLSYPVADPQLAVLLISAGSFCAAFGGPCAYTATIDMGGRHVTMVFSLMNMAGNIGATLFPLAVPYLLNEDPNVPNSGNWDLVLFTFAAMYLAAALCWLLANPSAGIDDAS